MADAILVCDACGLPPYPEGAPSSPDTGLPSGWVRRTFGRRTFTLCDCCGSVHHFKDGVSAYLQEALGLGPNAVCDFTKDTTPGSGMHRNRIKAQKPDGDPPPGAEP